MPGYNTGTINLLHTPTQYIQTGTIFNTFADNLIVNTLVDDLIVNPGGYKKKLPSVKTTFTKHNTSHVVNSLIDQFKNISIIGSYARALATGITSNYDVPVIVTDDPGFVMYVPSAIREYMPVMISPKHKGSDTRDTIDILYNNIFSRQEPEEYPDVGYLTRDEMKGFKSTFKSRRFSIQDDILHLINDIAISIVRIKCSDVEIIIAVTPPGCADSYLKKVSSEIFTLKHLLQIDSVYFHNGDFFASNLIVLEDIASRRVRLNDPPDNFPNVDVMNLLLQNGWKSIWE